MGLVFVLSPLLRAEICTAAWLISLWLLMFSLLYSKSSLLCWVFLEEQMELLLLGGGWAKVFLRKGRFWIFAEIFLLNYILTLLF